MPSFRAVIIEPPNYPHARVFFDIAAAFNGALHDLGRHNRTSGREIVFGAHLLPHFGGKIGTDSVLVNTEVPGSQWFNESYVNLLRQHEVWDYDKANVEYLLEHHQIAAKWCPIRYHKSLTRLNVGHFNFEADVLFYGSVNARRQAIWDAIKARCPTLRMKWLTHDDWTQRDYWIERSKIVLNMHYYDDAPLEMCRVSYLLANSAFILSEGPAWEGMKDSIMFAVPEYFPLGVELWAENESGRRNVRNRAFEKFQVMTQASAIEACIYVSA